MPRYPIPRIRMGRVRIFEAEAIGTKAPRYV